MIILCIMPLSDAEEVAQILMFYVWIDMFERNHEIYTSDEDPAL